MLNKDVFAMPPAGAAVMALAPAVSLVPASGTQSAGAGRAPGAPAGGHRNGSFESRGNTGASARITSAVSGFVAVETQKAIRDRVEVDAYVPGVPPRGAPV